MSDVDIAILGASHVTAEGVTVAQAVVPLSDDTHDVEPFGEIDLMSCLGVSALPWPQDKTGHAECVIARNCGGRDAVGIGGRDTRSSKIVGKMKPGDTVVHSTGPNQAAQLQLKEEKKQAALVSEDSDGHTMMVILDGKNNRIQITGFGNMIELSPTGINIVSVGDVLINGKTVAIAGSVILGGLTPNPAMKIMTAPTASPGGVASLPMIPAPGVSIGL